MKKYIRRFLMLLIIAVITLSNFIMVSAKTYTEGVDDTELDDFYKNYTLNGRQVIYNNELQMYVFQTENKTKVSKTFYHTIAWEFSRTLPGTKEYYHDANGNREYVMFDIDYLHEIEYNKKNGTTVATCTLQLDDVLNTIRAKDQGWYDEIMELKDNNITAYMMVDAVIQIVKVDERGKSHVSGFIDNGQYKGDLYFHENYKELNKTFTNKKVQDGIETHYNIDVSIGEPREEIKIEDDAKTEVPSTVAKMIIKKDYTDTNMSVNTTDSLYGGEEIL
ncbi:MAG: hypothetical protein ACOCN3_08280 [Roseburia inulinivorans]